MPVSGVHPISNCNALYLSSSKINHVLKRSFSFRPSKMLSLLGGTPLAQKTVPGNGEKILLHFRVFVLHVGRMFLSRRRGETIGVPETDYALFVDFADKVEAVLEDQAGRGKALKLTETETRTRFPVLVVASLGSTQRQTQRSGPIVRPF